MAGCQSVLLTSKPVFGLFADAIQVLSIAKYKGKQDSLCNQWQ